MKSNLQVLLRRGGGDLEGFIRPGCTHLTVDFALDAADAAALSALGVRGFVRHALVQRSGSPFWSTHTAMVRGIAVDSRRCDAHAQFRPRPRHGAV